MRAVLDTNVLLAGLLWRGPSYSLLEEVRNGTVTFLSSPKLLAELADVIVSGADGLLSLTSFESIPILNPAQALARVGDWA
jgi:predicted nucleic acid-binding protein